MVGPVLSAVDAATRGALRRALLARYPWLRDPDLGPASVEAGECDACGAEPRMAAPCGPPPPLPGPAGPNWALGRRCLLAYGDQVWCGGHETEAAVVVAWVRALPEEADTAARLWWVATGEVRLDPGLVDAARRLALLAGR